MLNFFFILLVIANARAKRCRGRYNVGASCGAVCDFSRGVWQPEACTEHFVIKQEEYKPPCFPFLKVMKPGCTNRVGSCEKLCNSNNECEFLYSGEIKDGVFMPPTVGNCSDNRSVSVCPTLHHPQPPP